MRRIARKEPRVPVAGSEERDHPQHPDEQLVARHARRAPRKGVHLGLEPPARDAAKRVGMDLLDRRAELVDVLRERRRSGGTSLRR